MKTIKNQSALKLRLTSLVLSITLLASFAGVRAMENDGNNDQETWTNPIHSLKAYLVEHGMLNQTIANDPNKNFGYSVHTGEGQITFYVYANENSDNPEQEINASTVWNQLQHLWTPNQTPNNQE